MNTPKCDVHGHFTHGMKIVCGDCYDRELEAKNRVRNLHKPIAAIYGGEEYCSHCWTFYPDMNIWNSEPYPCRTITVLEGEIND